LIVTPAVPAHQSTCNVQVYVTLHLVLIQIDHHPPHPFQAESVHVTVHETPFAFIIAGELNVKVHHTSIMISHPHLHQTQLPPFPCQPLHPPAQHHQLKYDQSVNKAHHAHATHAVEPNDAQDQTPKLVVATATIDFPFNQEAADTPAQPIPLISIIDDHVIEKSHCTFITQSHPLFVGVEKFNVHHVIVNDV
jgi:hypothetical protein